MSDVPSYAWHWKKFAQKKGKQRKKTSQIIHIMKYPTLRNDHVMKHVWQKLIIINKNINRLCSPSA